MVGETGNNDYTSALFQGRPVEELKHKLMPRIVQSIMDAVRVSYLDSDSLFVYNLFLICQ